MGFDSNGEPAPGDQFATRSRTDRRCSATDFRPRHISGYSRIRFFGAASRNGTRQDSKRDKSRESR
ncbi:hypothetical protein [Saccharopolyspora shandongensis]|uniref:hypothetical protein n=1 Tax=Saccharopolyspora shandongensis TaxID=418495 RepID=UPI0033EDBB2D